MAEDDKSFRAPVGRDEIKRTSGGLFKNLGDRANNIAARRNLEELNRLREEEDRGVQITAKYIDSKTDLRRAHAQLEDVDALIERDRAAVSNETEQLQFQQNEAKAKSDELTTAYEARKTQNEADTMTAAANKAAAELKLMALQEEIQRRKINGSSSIVNEIDAKLKELCVTAEDLEEQIATRLDPVLEDEDETVATKRRQVERELETVLAQIAVLEADREKWL